MRHDLLPYNCTQPSTADHATKDSVIVTVKSNACQTRSSVLSSTAREFFSPVTVSGSETLANALTLCALVITHVTHDRHQKD